MKPINRRKFIRKSAAIGGASIGLSLIPNFLRSNLLKDTSDIFSISSENPKESIPKLIKALGGIEAFVKPGNSVGFLINSPWVHQGYYTNPDIPLVIMQMCKEAGAKEIIKELIRRR